MSEGDFLDLYGNCGRKHCICLDMKHPLHRGWLGRRCADWTPLGAKSWDDLRRMAREKRAK